MKNLIAISLIITTSLSFGINETTVKSKINNVTVFLNGAQVFRKAQFKIKKGVSNIILDSISSNINANSIQVNGKGNYEHKMTNTEHNKKTKTK